MCRKYAKVKSWRLRDRKPLNFLDLIDFILLYFPV